MLKEFKGEQGKLEQLLFENFQNLKRALILIPKIAAETVVRGELKKQLEDAMNAVYEIVKLQNQESEVIGKQTQKNLEEGKSQGSFIGMFMKYFTEEVKEKSEIEQTEIDAFIEIKKDLKDTLHLQSQHLEQEPLEGVNSLTGSTLSKVHQLVTENASEDGSDFSGCDLGAFEGQETSIFQDTKIKDLFTLLAFFVRDNLTQNSSVMVLCFLLHLIQTETFSPDTLNVFWTVIQGVLN